MTTAAVAAIMAIAMALTPEQAIEIAQRNWPDGGEMRGVATSVQRLDRPGSAYFLVVLSRDDRAQAVITVDRETGRAGSSARLQAGGSPLRIDASRARRLAGAEDSADAELVWTPCQASRSPLYPFWRIRVTDRWRYVNQQEQIFDRLLPAGPGGAV